MSVNVPAGRVAVIGGGVSGLSAAHELVKRGFSVTVFDRRQVVGGKARSFDDTGTGLPGEHGFRFFPGFYFHVVETMKTIPAAGGGWVADHLTDLDTSIFADGNKRTMVMPLPTNTPRPLFLERIQGTWSFRKSLPGPWESLTFLGILARLVTSSERRWDHQLEHQSWLEHVMSTHRPRRPSENYRRLFAIGLTRSFVATRAEEMNARTGGKILLQLLYDTYFGPPIRRAPDRALDGPTTKVWIDPWQADLIKRGVTFRTGHEVFSVDATGGKVSGITWRRVTPAEDPTQPDVMGELEASGSDEFDWYVLAVPCEVLKRLLVQSPGVLKLDPELANVFNLKTRWMNGIVLGLPYELDPPLPKGHVLCLDSKWALTLLDQTKLWSEENLVNVTNRWKTLLSIDISDWDTPGLAGLPAKWPPPPRDDLVSDLWGQLQDHLKQLTKQPPPSDFVLDFDIRYPVAKAGAIAAHRTNDEPLLVNTTGSWVNRPKAKTAVSNLFIAGDFARTHTNFASMEAANEAAKRAVNALLTASGVDQVVKECIIENLQDPDVWWFKIPAELARRVDNVIFRLHLPLKPPFRLPVAAWVMLGGTSKVASLASGLLRR